MTKHFQLIFSSELSFKKDIQFCFITSMHISKLWSISLSSQCTCWLTKILKLTMNSN